MAESIDDETVQAKSILRRADLKTGAVLIVVSLLMMAKAATFPLLDSYGGVQNAWYVSPALMPLIVGLSLFVLACVLCGNAFAYAARQGGLSKLMRLPGARGREETQRFLSIAVYFFVYIYALIPHCDFVIATVLFLFLFVGTFSADGDHLVKKNRWLALVAGAAVWGVGVSDVLDPFIYYPTDIVASLAWIATIALNLKVFNQSAEERGRARKSLWIACAVTLVICGIFKYALLVPLPTEGAVVHVMDVGHFELRQLLRM